MEQLSNKALAHRAAELCLAKKGEDVMILDLRGLSSVTDFFVIASARVFGIQSGQTTRLGQGV